MEDMKTEEPTIQMGAEEATFVQAVLSNPRCLASRFAYADWLIEHGKHRDGHYLRQVRQTKFLRRLEREGAWALMAPMEMPPRVKDIQQYWNDQPPYRSERLKGWLRRIRRGWRVPAHAKTFGYYSMSKYLGVWIWEYLNVLAPMGV